MALNLTFPATRRVAVLAILALLSASARSDTLTEDSVKAGFVLNFAKYTEWPTPALNGGELRVCGLGAQPLSGRLVQLQGRQVHGLETRVTLSPRPEEWRSCHILFIPSGEAQRAEALLRTLAQAPVLTVSDSSEFARAGGMIELKLRAGRIRFDINHGAARRVGLNFSSQLLKLADEVLP
jgi:hypothetical protein